MKFDEETLTMIKEVADIVKAFRPLLPEIIKEIKDVAGELGDLPLSFLEVIRENQSKTIKMYLDLGFTHDQIVTLISKESAFTEGFKNALSEKMSE